MRINKLLFTVAVATCIVGCSRPSSSRGDERLRQPPLVVVATIQELMESEVDPAADSIWASVGTVITKAGEEDRKPSTEEQWGELRRHAITLIEATNLLVMPGRRVATIAFPSAGPGVLSSAEIDAKIAGDHAGFEAYAAGLRQVALNALKAIDDRNVAALAREGEALDQACEACHMANWYPHEVIPALPDFDHREKNPSAQSIGLPDT